MNLTDSQLSQRGSEKLELAILSFFEQFRKMYVGDQAQKTSKVKLSMVDFIPKLRKIKPLLPSSLVACYSGKLNHTSGVFICTERSFDYVLIISLRGHGE